MTPRNERWAKGSLSRSALVRVVLGGLVLLVIGCSTPGAKHRAASFTQTPDGFTISENERMGVRLRSDFDKARRALDEGELERGIELLREIVDSSPEFAAPHINLAIAYQRSNDFEKAASSLLRALEVNPRHAVAHNELGIVYRRLGRFEDAKASYEAALELHPEFHFARKNLAILCDLFLNDIACALENYRKYHQAVPGDDATEMWIADLQNRSGQ